MVPDLEAVLRIREISVWIWVRNRGSVPLTNVPYPDTDPDPGSGAFLTQDPGWGLGSFLRAEKHFFGLKIQYLNSLMRIRIRDRLDPGSGIWDGKIRIRDPQH